MYYGVQFEHVGWYDSKPLWKVLQWSRCFDIQTCLGLDFSLVFFFFHWIFVIVAVPVVFSAIKVSRTLSVICIVFGGMKYKKGVIHKYVFIFWSNHQNTGNLKVILQLSDRKWIIVIWIKQVNYQYMVMIRKSAYYLYNIVKFMVPWSMVLILGLGSKFMQ